MVAQRLVQRCGELDDCRSQLVECIVCGFDGSFIRGVRIRRRVREGFARPREGRFMVVHRG
jgi:hypothetical protein